MKKKLHLTLLIILIFSLELSAQIIAEEILHHAHAHNDYAKKNPLWNALSHGCASIEIDVFAFKNTLRVAHINLCLKKKQTLTDRYLAPLQAILEQRDHIYKDQTLVLMIDFKSNCTQSLELLKEAINPMLDKFTYYSEGEIIEGPLKLVISGNSFQYEQVAHDDRIYFFKDGSVVQCEEAFPSALIPRGSSSYGSHFKWNGKKDMPELELLKLSAMVEEAEKCNKKLRFYAMPAKEKIWKTFLEAGVYWINVDHPKKFKQFYTPL